MVSVLLSRRYDSIVCIFFKDSVYGLKPKKKLSDLKKKHVMILKPSNNKTENIGASDSASENQKNNSIIHESYS